MKLIISKSQAGGGFCIRHCNRIGGWKGIKQQQRLFFEYTCTKEHQRLQKQTMSIKTNQVENYSHIPKEGCHHIFRKRKES